MILYSILSIHTIAKKGKTKMFYDSSSGNVYDSRQKPYASRRYRYNYQKPGHNYYDHYDCYDYPYWNYPCNNYNYR